MCFRCKKSSHFAGKCPEFKGKEDAKKGKAGVFALTQKETEKDPDVITGILSVFNIPAIILIDSSATNSFISASFHAKIENMCESVNDALEVSIPSGETIITNLMSKAVNFEVDVKNLEADLYLIDMRDFDIILGMDWRSCNHATIKCHERDVLFQKSGECEFTFFGTKVKTMPRVISMLKAQRMLRNSTSQGYLVSITSVQATKVTATDVPVVRNFVDVFPEDLFGIPPIDKWNSIDLVPGATPISKAPYRMAPNELQELKVQLQELLDKGFIRPSVSP